MKKQRTSLLVSNGVHANLGGRATISNPSILKAPFPYMGGKAKVADLVWSRFGNVDNYVEPFAGSLAVLLRRPALHFADGHRVETCNDLHHYIVNFWRAVAAEPDEVAKYADWPVMEADLHARHDWLVRSDFAKDWRKRIARDPHHYDAKIAGWWAWGASCWIGSGWCAADGSVAQIDDLSNGTVGVNGRPQLTNVFDIGQGVNAGGNLSVQVPELLHGRGYDAATVEQSPTGVCDARREWLTDWMRRLADRLRLVRTCYGHWARVCDSDSTLTRIGTTGVFLDPPYPSHRADTGKKSRDATIYATDKVADLNKLRDEVLAWCVKWGSDSQIRIAVCGYEGDGYEPLADEHGWTCELWEAGGGYGNAKKSRPGKSENAKRERIWFSPACVPPPATLFDSI